MGYSRKTILFFISQTAKLFGIFVLIFLALWV